MISSFFFSSRRRHTRFDCDWSSDVCSSDLLFQGFSGEVRLALPKRIGLFASLGKSKTTTDKKNSWNQAYGLSLRQIWKTGVLLDLHYSKFDSAFGSGKYESFSLSKSLTDAFRVQVYGG